MSNPSAVSTFVVWDYVVFAGMLLISAAIGIYYAVVDRAKQSSKDFLIGGRTMTAVPVALSLTASFMSAVTVLATPAEIYRYGAIFSIFSISYLFVIVICSEFFLPVFYRLGITSTYEYLEMRFNKVVRLCGTLLFIIQTVLYTGIVIYVPALALNQVTGFDLWGAVVSTGVVCTFYCTMGGLKAVVWTDVFQVGIMVAGFVSVIIRAIVIRGGLTPILQDAYDGGRINFWDFDVNPLRRHTFWTITVGGSFIWIYIYGVNQSQVQRYIACKTRLQAKMSLYINLLGLWIIVGCATLAGLSMYSVYRDCDPWTAGKVKALDQLIPYLVMDILRDFPGVPGLFVAAAYSGTLSTVSSSINALAAVTVEDLIRPQFTSLTDTKLSWISKGTTLLYGLMCIGMAGLASLMGGLLQAAITIFGIAGGPLLGLFVLGIFFPWANSVGALVGVIAGFALSLWVGIGSQMYPQPLAYSRPLNLSTAGCNVSFTFPDVNLTDVVYLPTMPPLAMMETTMQVGVTLAEERSVVVDNWYSLSYLYFSTVGTLTVVAVGLVISIFTGGRKQYVNPEMMFLAKEDFPKCSFKCHKDLSTDNKSETGQWKSQNSLVTDMGTINAAFTDIELNYPETNERTNGIRL
ncbi:sodium-coupled monocarboxylate transporter 1 [Protopterus annectens]|uniref:sodium-coupled monocarboxylate transporter 1 n=1 Tax=Protopterus annectens TaxID=7888 RepID=UPI001CF9E1D3|nr:sodium-coupled monocarboxylate transporter 1 [Protopterus annectens]